jgi:phytoene synthase
MTPRLAQSYAYCERLARRSASNFYYAFRLLPPAQRRAMHALYAFLRIADDIGDGTNSNHDKKNTLENWRQRLADALSKQYSHRLHAALHHTVSSYRIPVEYLHAVLDGVEMDLNAKTYATFKELYTYCYRVASAVGLACIHVWGYQDERALVHAESAGIAFQLTNILRDIREDVARDRIYLPQEDLARFNYSREMLIAGNRNDSFRALMRFQIARARQYYQNSEPLSELLHGPGRSVFAVMSRTYQGLLTEIERRDYDVFSARVRLPSWQKLWLTAQALPARCGW